MLEITRKTSLLLRDKEDLERFIEIREDEEITLITYGNQEFTGVVWYVADYGISLLNECDDEELFIKFKDIKDWKIPEQLEFNENDEF